ncbi:hypothetical protein [Congzhengia minquanensis]|uniref:Uncharacterized protein n=1 Tax=Congzhengia minquanensis TaxID=2763657 RepID=A0A926DP79_9FIRM|nr:hypothetical protein [Congzhengia minquanensis]MBC8540809.1 hypothetical protein [Congzhengia minquanensis]
MNKSFIIEMLKNCKSWEEGTIITFRHKDWELIFRKEESIYKPFTVSGKKRNSNETISRRYTNAEKAFLHILNGFNENTWDKVREAARGQVELYSVDGYEIVDRFDERSEGAKVGYSLYYNGNEDSNRWFNIVIEPVEVSE